MHRKIKIKGEDFIDTYEQKETILANTAKVIMIFFAIIYALIYFNLYIIPYFIYLIIFFRGYKTKILLE